MPEKQLGESIFAYIRKIITRTVFLARPKLKCAQKTRVPIQSTLTVWLAYGDYER